MKFRNFFHFFWVIFDLLDPDPADQNQCGSGASATKLLFNLQKNSLSYLLVLLLCAEVSLDNIKGLLIDLHVLVGLEELDLVEAEDLLDDDSVGVGAARLLGLLLAQPQDVLQPIQRDLPTT
jgi:hypothetical protein